MEQHLIVGFQHLSYYEKAAQKKLMNYGVFNFKLATQSKSLTFQKAPYSARPEYLQVRQQGVQARAKQFAKWYKVIFLFYLTPLECLSIRLCSVDKFKSLQIKMLHLISIAAHFIENITYQGMKTIFIFLNLTYYFVLKKCNNLICKHIWNSLKSQHYNN